MTQQADVVIIGAGAAGLMAGIWAGRTNPAASIVILDSAKQLGAKILVSGGGRCNVTHDHVDEAAFAGSTRPAIRKALRRFDVARTIEFFHELGVELKREETGKLFPTTDSARTVLDALLGAARDAGAIIEHPRRVESIRFADGKFHIGGEGFEISSARVVIATGGRSLPKTGSDGHGYSIAQSLGHSITPRVFPALVALTLPRDHFLCGLSGLSAPAAVEVRSGTGKRLVQFTGPVLCTHFGLSGPAIMDISRYFLDARMDDPEAKVLINWMPDRTVQEVDAMLQEREPAGAAARLKRSLPENLARGLCEGASVDPGLPSHRLTREARLRLLRTITELHAPINGDRGFAHAEVTAGGVPLSEINLNTMESRIVPGLYLCGEICDVDGRIGGYNFQWAWASGYVAGISVAAAPVPSPEAKRKVMPSRELR